jgi:hypothetical protein
MDDPNFSRSGQHSFLKNFETIPFPFYYWYSVCFGGLFLIWVLIQSILALIRWRIDKLSPRLAMEILFEGLGSRLNTWITGPCTLSVDS